MSPRGSHLAKHRLSPSADMPNEPVPKLSFWAVWWDGLEWPQLYRVKHDAQAMARKAGQNHVGKTVYLLELVCVGSLEYSNMPIKTTGELERFTPV